MIIGWLMDDPGYKGGAELDSELLIAAAPDDIVVTVLPPDDTEASVGTDGFIVGNCTQYKPDCIETLYHAPVIKRVYDVWPHGDETLKRWLLDNSRAIIPVNPTQMERAHLETNAKVVPIPCAVDLTAFRLDWGVQQRAGYVWIGRLYEGKGIAPLARWAEKQKIQIDVYGYGPEVGMVDGNLRYCGEVQPDRVASVLARYETFVFLPTQFDPCPRSVIEAWAAGCKLVLNRNVGTLWWLENNEAALLNAAETFWTTVREAINQ
jgi:glycosyltransferase involved in cell wall biosynthesis